MTTKALNFIQGSLFEEDYLIRTLGNLARKADVALTELVANAWDAGASKVDITIPEVRNQKLIIEDDGIGLTKAERHSFSLWPQRYWPAWSSVFQQSIHGHYAQRR